MGHRWGWRGHVAAMASIAGIAAAAMGAGPASAGAIGFGANLNTPTNATSTCDSGAFDQSSCLFFSTIPGPSLFAPVSGTVTAVHVRTGSGHQGPMQVVVMSQLYQNNPSGGPAHIACCFIEAYGPTFTPKDASLRLAK